MSNLHRVSEFYALLLEEIGESGYSSQEISLLRDRRLYYGRYLSIESRNYFIQTVIPCIAQAISYFSLPERGDRSILDLGCGLGMQSLIFASLGGKVVGVDIRRESVSLCRKRKAYYEKKLQTVLDVEFHECDFRRSHPSDFDMRFDCVFSMSAFSYISPLERTVNLLSSLLKEDSLVFLYEENAAYLFGLSARRARLPNPRAGVDAFRREGFSPDFHYGGCSLPPFLWRIASLNRFLRPVNDLLRKRRSLAFNYVLGMKRGAG